MPARVKINPRIVDWATHWNSSNLDEIATKLSVSTSTVNGWMEGTRPPTMRQAQSLASALKIPLGYLFLERPPRITLPVPDLRSGAFAGQSEPSIDFIEVVFDALRKRDWYRNFRIQLGFDRLDFVGKFDHSSPVSSVAEDMRARLQSRELQSRAQSWEQFFRELVARAESIGLTVLRSGTVSGNTHRTLAIEEFRGFAISDAVAPIIFINIRDSKASQVFTLAHEVAHIWIGQSAVSDQDGSTLDEPLHTIESLCNSIAAEFLVPRIDISHDFRGIEPTIDNVNLLARRYRVSAFVIIRRLLELEFIDVKTFGALSELAKAAIVELDRGDGGHYYRSLFARNGGRFTRDVVYSVARGDLGFVEAGTLLGASARVVTKLVAAAQGKAVDADIPL